MYLVSYTSVTSYDMDITSDLFSLLIQEALMSVLEQVKW